MSRSFLGRAIVAGLVLLTAACGGGGGGGGGGAINADDDVTLDPTVDFFLTGASFARPILGFDGELTQLVNPASLYEVDPLTGIALPGFPKVLNQGASLASLATLNLAQILDPLTPQVPLVPRNAAIVLRFSMPVDATTLNLTDDPAGDSDLITTASTVQIRRKSGEIVPARAFVDGPRVVILGITEDTLGFEASPLVFDQTGTVVEDSTGFLRITLGGGVGTGTLRSTTGVAVKARVDRLGSTLRPLPVNPGNSALDAIVQQTDTGTVTFNGFLPDLTAPRVIRPVMLAGNVELIGFAGSQVEIRDSSLPTLPNTAANGGDGEWANARLEITSVGGSSQYEVESNRNEGGVAVFRLKPGQVLDAAVAVGDVYELSRTEFFEPVPPPFPSDSAQLAAVTVDPVNVPRDPNDPQDLLNSDLRYFVRMFDEAGVEQTDRWNPSTGTFLSVPPKSSLRVRFSEAMDLASFNAYETFFVANGALPATDPAFDDMRVGRTLALDNGRVIEFQPWLEDQEDPSRSAFVGFGGSASQLRLVLRTIPSDSTIDELRQSATPGVLAQLEDLDDLGISGCIDLGGRGLGLPSAVLDQGDTENFLLNGSSPVRGPFPPAVDVSMTFETMPSADPDFGVVVHRFLGQAETSTFSYPAGVVHDSVTAGVEFNDFPPVDEDGDGTIDRRYIYGPQVVEVGLNIPGRLTGAPAAVIQHLIDDNNPPKPAPFSSPNGEDFLISLGFGVSTPLNSGYGARFQHVYRSGDASPAKTDFVGVTLDLVGLAWSPFNDQVANTVLDDFELLVGQSNVNRGLGPNTNQTNGIPQDGGSGLIQHFDCNRLEWTDNCCLNLTPNLQNQLNDNPQAPTISVVQQGTPYVISSTRLFKPANAGSTFNQYLDYPTFNNGLDPVFGKSNVFAYPYDSRFPMLIEYSVGPNEAPPQINLYRFSPGILTSVLPRFRVWSQGQHPAAWGVPNWTVGPLLTGPNWFRAGEGGPLLKPGTFSAPVEPTRQNNGMPTQFPNEYILPPRNDNCQIQQITRDPENGEVNDNNVITELPIPTSDPRGNYYFANGMLMYPLPNGTAYPGPTGQPPTMWFGYGVPLGAIGIAVPTNLGFSNNPNVASNEPGMSPPPSEYGDNARYYMMWKYRKRVSIVESPTIRIDGDAAQYRRPIVNPPVSTVDPAASLAVDFKAGRTIDFAVAALDSGYVRSDEPDIETQLSGPDAQHVYVKFRASFGVAPASTQPPIIDSIIIPYEKVSP